VLASIDGHQHRHRAVDLVAPACAFEAGARADALLDGGGDVRVQARVVGMSQPPTN
jgi:hypothetical protein